MPRPLEFRRRGTALPLLVLLLLIAVPLPFALWFWWALTPLEKQYLPTYAAVSMSGSMGMEEPVWWVWKTAPRRPPELAHDADAIAATYPGHPPLALSLSPQAWAAGWTGLIQVRQLARPELTGATLREQFFAGESVFRLLLTPLCGTAILLLISVPLWRRAGQSEHEERHGRRTKGPELGAPSRWDLRPKRGGVRLRLAGKAGFPGGSFRIPEKLLASHVLLMGDTGSGKSNAIRQILRQAEQRGESAIVYDPAGEFVQEFCRPERRDVVLNPLDARCPYWALPSELSDPGLESMIAAAMLPEKQYENGFFTDAPRRVLAALLERGGTVETLLQWMADPDRIEQLLAGTPQAAYLDPKAAPQRAGIMASLNLIADSLALLPKQGETEDRFSTDLWKYDRTRWVFLTSRPAARERILPLHSAWLDLFIVRMMEPSWQSTRPVWFVLDELASLNKLPQLHTAVTENRKYGNPVVLGFQGRSQLEKRYGQDAEAMLSQPATKIFFKTSEPRAAKWISETLGEIEVERLKESRSPGLLRSKKNFAMEIATKPLVMASEVAGLEPLRGYIKQENRVVPVRFAYVPKRSLQPEFVERQMTIPGPRSLPPPVAEPVPAKAEVKSSKSVQPPPVQPSPKAVARQPREAMSTVPVVKPEPAMPLFAECAPEEPTQPEHRKSAFKKKEGAVREWKPTD